MGSPAPDLRAVVSRRLAALENRRGELLGARVRARIVESMVRDGSSWRRQLTGLGGQSIGEDVRLLDRTEATRRAFAGAPIGGYTGAELDGGIPADPDVYLTSSSGIRRDPGAELLDAVGAFGSHLTNNVSSPSRGAQLPEFQGRRRSRWRLRETAQRITDGRRLASCGHMAGESGVAIVIGESGIAHFSGLRYCGRLWVCPVCAPRIAYGRSVELTELLRRHADAGGGTIFATMTVPHEYADALKPSRALPAELWRRAKQGREWQAEAREYGIVGIVRALEVTHGVNGWHPHLHALILTDRELSNDDVEAWRRSFGARWIAACERLAGRTPLLQHQVWQRAHSAADLAEYVAKISRAEENDTTGGHAARELTRWDMKGGAQHAGRPGRTPFGILADYRAGRERERAIRAELARPLPRSRRAQLERQLAELRRALKRDRALWHEWEHGIHGARQLTGLSPLLKRYEVADATDEELANARIGGIQLCRLTPELWHAVKMDRSLATLLLEEAEDGGVGAVADLLADVRERWRERGMLLSSEARLEIEPLAIRAVA